MATTALPIAIAGATSETKPSSGASSGQATPITPIGSFIASVTMRNGVWCTSPSHLSAHADRKSTRLNSSHLVISYAVFCLKKKKKLIQHNQLPCYEDVSDTH